MKVLHFFRPVRRRARPVGTTLERGTGDTRKARRRNVVVKAGIFLALTVLTVASFPQGEVFQYTVDVGDEWRRETLIAPFDFALYKSREEIQAERREVRRNTPPLFERVDDAQPRIRAHRDTLAQQLNQIFDAFQTFQLDKSRGRLEEAEQDSMRFSDLRRSSRLKLTNDQWEILLEDYAARIPGLSTTTRVIPTGPRLDEFLLHEAYEFSTSLLSQGVLDIPRDSVLSDAILIRDEREHTETTRDKEDLYGLNEVYKIVQDDFLTQYTDEPELVNIVSAMVRAIFVPSLRYLRVRSLQQWQQAQAQISITRGKVAQGEVIVREGQRVTHEIRQRLISLERAMIERGGVRLQWKRIVGQILLALSTFAVFFLYLFMVRRPIFDDNQKVFLIALLFAGVIGLFALTIRIPSLALYAVPVAIVSVLFTVIFDSRVGLFGTLTLALIGGLLLNYDFEFTFATLMGGTLGVFSVRDIKNRGQFFLSAGLVFLGYLLIMGATWLFLGRSGNQVGMDVLYAGVNSFLLIIAYPLLWIFERAFDITTDLTLLELSDTNRPLLKELSLRAPGTFNHSLQVANLAEAAAAAIGANALLTRVGALYHDIGKMIKPEYFVENQRPGLNPHDQLKPRMSALIIASHVKEGLEMGRQHRLPQRVLDFIPMHHGTTRIEYFYRKALDDHQPNEPPLLEGEFRYPGPRPLTKETGILMLADGVEAASRSLSDPSHKRLESLIEMIVSARIEDGQLDNTELTFRDLTKIKETFLALLLGIYHIRVRYPGQDEEGGTDRKKALPRETAEAEAQPASSGQSVRPEGPPTDDATGDSARVANGRVLPEDVTGKADGTEPAAEAAEERPGEP